MLYRQGYTPWAANDSQQPVYHLIFYLKVLPLSIVGTWIETSIVTG